MTIDPHDWPPIPVALFIAAIALATFEPWGEQARAVCVGLVVVAGLGLWRKQGGKE